MGDIVRDLAFELEKVTKGAVRYKEIIPDGSLAGPLVGTIYLRKDALAGAGLAEPPKKIRVTVSVEG